MILHELNIGGGHGVPYVSGDPELNLAELADIIDDALDWACAAERFPRPRIVVEPGRAISARAGRDAVSGGVGEVAAGRTDVRRRGRRHVRQPRVALYGAKYTVALANRHALGADASRSRSPDGTASRATRSPATSNCPPTSTPAICRGRVHRRISAQHGVQLQHGGPAADRRGQARQDPGTGPPRDDRPTCCPATSDGQAAPSAGTTSTPPGSTPT